MGLVARNLSSKFALNKGPDQPAHPHSLISAFAILLIGKDHIQANFQFSS